MHRSSDCIDESSRLRQFAWEQCDDRIIAVIFRPGKYGLTRFVVKRYIEQVLSQADRWKRLLSYFPQSLPSVRAYSLTSYEIELMRRILDYHLGDSLHLRISQAHDQLIDYEELIDFISHAQEFYNKDPNLDHQAQQINGKTPSIPSIPSIYMLPPIESTSIKSSAPSSQSSITQASTTPTNGHHLSVQSSLSNPSIDHPVRLPNPKIDGNGWVQINNVYLPFIIKNHQRLVPYPVLLSCKILEPDELRSALTPATSTDVTLINSMIRDGKVNNGQIPDKTSLINVYHVLIGTKKLVYAKLLPKDTPTSKINRQYKSILVLRGGFLTINTRRVPFVCSSNRSYVPLNEILTIYPHLHMQLKGLARAPRTNEFDYLQLVQMYSKAKELPSDTLLVNMEDLNQRQIISSRSLTLIEYQTKEKTKLDEQMKLFNKSLASKRKHIESHANQQPPPPQKINSSTPTATVQNQWLSSNHGHRGKPRWQ